MIASLCGGARFAGMRCIATGRSGSLRPQNLRVWASWQATRGFCAYNKPRLAPQHRLTSPDSGRRELPKIKRASQAPNPQIAPSTASLSGSDDDKVDAACHPSVHPEPASPSSFTLLVTVNRVRQHQRPARPRMGWEADRRLLLSRH